MNGSVSSGNRRLGGGVQPRWSEWVEIDRSVRLDDGVVLGYLPGRDLSSKRLVIGAGSILRFGTVVYAGTAIGRELETGHHVVIREQNRLGDGVRIWNNSTIDYGCTIGNRVKIHCNCYVAQFSDLEDDVFLAPGVTIANDKYPGWDASPIGLVGPTIRRGAQIGVNVTILPGVTIGAGAIVGAGSVVTRDVDDGIVVVGTPARAVRQVRELREARGARK